MILFWFDFDEKGNKIGNDYADNEVYELRSRHIESNELPQSIFILMMVAMIMAYIVMKVAGYLLYYIEIMGILFSHSDGNV